MPLWKSGLAALALAGLTATAFAQAPSARRDPNMPDPKTVPAEKIRPQEPGSTGSTGGQTLSERLEQTEGVIKPPPMGSEMVVRPPVANPNSMPVITPPGTSPSDPIQPK
jgi:hypothetical protein